MNNVEQYVQALKSIHDSAVGTDELTYYTPLLNLLNAVGSSLKPKVKAVGNLADMGAGHPDAGLFSTKQAAGSIPERGVVEVKGTAADVIQVAQSDQVAKYLNVYRQVLVTNYWNFALVGYEHEGRAVILESYKLTDDENDFWQKTAYPRKLAEEHAEPFIEYLRRVMLHPTMLSRPQDVAWFLASYARDALTRISDDNLPGLANIRTAVEEALGLTFKDEKGDRFFRSTLIQTLFYGIFSAWVLWHKHNPIRVDRFDWRTSAFELHVPVIQVLFEQLSVPSKLHALGLMDILDLVGNVLNRVDRAEFFAHFSEGEAVQYFYEPFLEAFSPKLRKELGVWYTPSEVVNYMVERVDTVLREELDIADGLADENVYVLDPCCGTGAYLVSVLQKIADKYEEKGMAALSGVYIKKAAIERVFGFEILPAPFVIAHLQIGLFLQNLNVPLATDERAGIYLTNALTGWRPPEEPKQTILFPELAEERDAAERVKQKAPILVVLGNPPYNGFAGIAMGEERELTTAYRKTKHAPKPQGPGLNNLYVRFFRMAERCIVEMKPHKGVICFISDYSWFDGLSFPGMRERYLNIFSNIWIDNLNGDKYRTGKIAPDGSPDPSIFSTKWNPEGIQVGTAISLLVHKAAASGTDTIWLRDLWGRTKWQQLSETSIQQGNELYEAVIPTIETGLAFTATEMQANYLSWPLLSELFPVSFPGVKTSRDDALIDFEYTKLSERMQQYFDPTLSHEEVKKFIPRLMQSNKHFDAESTRRYLCQRGFLKENIVRYCYRPFDNRWLYWEPETKLLDRNRPEYFPNIFEGNIYLFTTGRTRKNIIEPALSTELLLDLNCMDSGARGFPLYLLPATNGTLLANINEGRPVPNLSNRTIEYLKSLATHEQDLFYHCLCILHSTTYRKKNRTALRQNWPRIPLPNTKELLTASATLGHQISALLDTVSEVTNVTTSNIRSELQVIALVTHVTGGQLNPAAGDLALTGSWGYLQSGTITMPGQGTYIERAYTSDELQAVTTGANVLGLTQDEAINLLGKTTYDIYLNNVAYWRNVPANVWKYTIGGYQVIKKWLSYREKAVLGRDLKPEEVMEVTNIARRIATIILLQPQLDANYQAVKSSIYPWPQK